MFGGFVDAEPEAELFKHFRMLRFGAMEMFALGDELEVRAVRNARLPEHALKRFQILGIDDEQLVFVKLYLHGSAGADDGNAGAAVMHEKFFKVAAIALEDGQVDLLAMQVLVASAVTLMARFHDDIDHFAERIEQIEKNIKEMFARNGGHQYRNLQLGFHIAVGADAKPLAGDNLQVERRPHGFGQPEIAVVIHLQVSRQLVWNHETPCR